MTRVGDYGADSLAFRARTRRMNELVRRFPGIASMHVIDLGGYGAFWMHGPVHPRHVTVVNLDPDEPRAGWIDHIAGDACTFRAVTGDLVVSNSLLEHVGGVQRRFVLAETIRALAPRYWVQTPYRYFPIEPHWLFPGFQFLPLAARTEIGLRWRRGHIRATTREESRREAMWVELLGLAELRSLFPEAEIWRERWAGLTKSIVAISP